MATRSGKLLRQAGEALYGELWQSQMSRDLNISRTTLSRWVDGQYPVWPEVWRLLREKAATRRIELGELATKLREASRQ